MAWGAGSSFDDHRQPPARGGKLNNTKSQGRQKTDANGFNLIDGDDDDDDDDVRGGLHFF